MPFTLSSLKDNPQNKLCSPLHPVYPETCWRAHTESGADNVIYTYININILYIECSIQSKHQLNLLCVDRLQNK